MKPEQKIWQRLKRALDKIPEMQYHRVELKTSETGFPDVMYCLGGVGFIELKFGNNLNNWRPNQRRWAKQKEKHNVPCYVLTGNDTSTWLLKASHHYDTDEIERPLAVWGTSLDPLLLAKWLVIPDDRTISFLRDELQDWPKQVGKFGKGQFVKGLFIKGGLTQEILYYSDQGGVYCEKDWLKTVTTNR